VQNVLGLPRFGFGKTDRDTLNGGFAGFHSEAARGLYNAVRNWENAVVPEEYEPKLVVNLSLGWLREFGGEDPATASTGVQAFYHVLQRASCDGALVVAAAGNDRDDCDEHAMLPAAWEEHPAPDDLLCEEVGVDDPVVDGATYKPLIHSVGAVGWDDVKIDLSRVNGLPRLAALGSSVVGPDLERGPLTGTSMSAAAVSGIAALVWGYNPTLTAHEVADVIWSSGIDTGKDADYGVDGQLDDIRRATACAALTEACNRTGKCPNFSLVCGETLDTTALETEIAGMSHDNGFLEKVAVKSIGECETYCGEFTEVFQPQNGIGGCEPVQGLARTDYLTVPQPDNPACLGCTWATSNTGQSTQITDVYATLSPNYATWTIEDVDVEFIMTNGSSVTKDLDESDIRDTNTTSLRNENAIVGEIRSGTITITLRSPQNRVMVNSDPMVTGAVR
jgi:hypothetical protein